jgi:hypothetical protein
MRFAILLLGFGALLSAETFSVALVKPLWRDGKGTLEINDQGITYTVNAKKQMSWKWLDIQYFDRLSRREFVILTYKDDWKFLGRDKQYHFRITRGELSDALFERIGGRLKRPVTDRVIPPGIVASYSIPVKRERTFKGSEGTLEFSNDTIYYVTNDRRDARVWRMDRDIVSVWSDDPYRLEIRAYGNNRRAFSRTATYKFDLKEKLNPEFYRQLKLRLYNLEANDQVIR